MLGDASYRTFDIENKREEEHTARKYNDRERSKMYNAIKQTLESTKPDELDTDHLGYVRAWWD